MNSTSNELVQATQNLLSQNKTGFLATHSIKHPGYPYTSLVSYAVSAEGNPLFLISSLATHTKNLRSNNKASILIASESDNPQAAGRATLIGDIAPVSDEKCDEAKLLYVQKHPEAKQWAEFGDFAIYQMTIIDIYIVAGIGKMGWLKPEQLKPLQ